MSGSNTDRSKPSEANQKTSYEIGMRQVFISYSHKDQEFFKRLASDLAAHLPNAKVFHDELLPPGESFADTLEAKIEQADIVLALLSPDYLESRWTKQELNVALDRRLKKQARVLPLMVRPCRPTGFVAQLTWVDFTKNYEDALARLIREISGEPIMSTNPELQAEVAALKAQLATAPGVLDVKLAISLLALLVAVWAAVAPNRADVENNLNKENATVVTDRNEVTKTLILLPANRLWLDTGLEVKKGQSVTITASGSINLAAHRLVEAMKDHKRPPFGWIGPDGGKYPYPRSFDNKRSKSLIFPDPDYYGALLACIVPAGDLPLGLKNPKPNGIKRIGSRGSITAEATGSLWLVVNDVILTEQSHDDYVHDQDILNAVYGPGKVTEAQKEKEWKEIKNEGYYEAFFDDNLGELLIQIDFTK